MLKQRSSYRLTARLRSLCAVAALAAAGLSACGDDSDTSAGGDTGGGIPEGPIVIGNAIAMSGAVAPYDLGPADALKVAVDDINKDGGAAGHKLKLVYSDTTSVAEKGASAALDVIGEGAKVVVVTCDFDLGAPAAQAAVSKGVVAISTCGGSDRFNPNVLGPLVFTMGTRAYTEGEVLARWAYEQKGFRKAYLLRDTTLAYAQDLCKGVEENFPKQDGASIAGSGTFKEGDTRVTAQLSDIRRSGADFVVLCSGTGGGAPVLKQMRAAGIDTPVLGGAAFDGDYWLEAVPDLSNFWYSTYGSIFGDDPRPEVNRLFERMTELNGKRPDTSYSLTGYALGEAVKLAVEEANSVEGEALSAALETFDEEPLILGSTTFDSEWHITQFRPMAMIEVKDGTSSFLEIYPKE